MKTARNHWKGEGGRLAGTAFAVLVVVCLLVTVLGVEAYPHDYDETIDGGWTCGDRDSSQSGAGRGSSDCVPFSGRAHVLAGGAAQGSGWAKAEVCGNFELSSGNDHPYYNHFVVYYTMYGEIRKSSGAQVQFYVDIEVWELDVKGNADLLVYGERVESEFSADEFPEEQRDHSFDVCILTGKEYQVKLIVEAQCDVQSGHSGWVDFHYWKFGDYYVSLDRVEMSHTHPSPAEDQGLPHSGEKKKQAFDMKQNKHDAANRVTFTSYNVDAKINGWTAKITDFDWVDGEKVGDMEIDVEAGGAIVCRGYKVHVDIVQYIEEDNDAGYTGPTWYSAEKSPLAGDKALPDHYWRVGYPYDAGGGLFGHQFTMINHDDQYDLIIEGLRFLPSMSHYDDLRDITFPQAPSYSFTRVPGDSFTTEILTDGALFGGYIYFTYNMYDCQGQEIACNAWGGHPVMGLGGCWVPAENRCIDSLTRAQCLALGGTYYGEGRTCGEGPVIPTLTEWGLIIFGVVLLGFITWVFLRKRKAVVSLR